MYLNSSEHAGGGDAEVQVGQRVGVGRFIQQRRFLLWQIIWREQTNTQSAASSTGQHICTTTPVCVTYLCPWREATSGRPRRPRLPSTSAVYRWAVWSSRTPSDSPAGENDERKHSFVLNAASSCRVSPPNKLFNKNVLWDLRQSNSDLRRRLLPGSSLFTSHSFIHLVFYTAGWFLSLNSVFSVVCSELNKICLDPFTFWGAESWKNPSFIHLNASLKVPYYKAFSTS